MKVGGGSGSEERRTLVDQRRALFIWLVFSGIGLVLPGDKEEMTAREKERERGGEDGRRR